MDAIKFGAFVAELRKENHLTQAQLAERLHVTDKAVSKWERGAGLPDITNMEALAEALQISLAELLQCRRQEEQVIDGEAVEAILSETLDMAIHQKRHLAGRMAAAFLAALMGLVPLLLGVYFYVSRFELIARGTGELTPHTAFGSTFGYHFALLLVIAAGITVMAGCIAYMLRLANKTEWAFLFLLAAEAIAALYDTWLHGPLTQAAAWYLPEAVLALQFIPIFTVALFLTLGLCLRKTDYHPGLFVFIGLVNVVLLAANHFTFVIWNCIGICLMIGCSIGGLIASLIKRSRRRNHTK